MKTRKTKEKVAFITGANRGLGLETARQLGKLGGITLVLGVRDAKKAKDALKYLKGEGVEATAISFDLTDPKSAKKAYRYFEKNYGRLDILINNAGVFLDPDKGSNS